jgi:hypothetical protein
MANPQSQRFEYRNNPVEVGASASLMPIDGRSPASSLIINFW